MSVHDTLDLGLTALTPGRSRAVVGAPLGRETGWALMEDGSCRPMYGNPPKVGATTASGEKPPLMGYVLDTAWTACLLAIPVGGAMVLGSDNPKTKETGKKVLKVGVIGGIGVPLAATAAIALIWTGAVVLDPNHRV